GRPSKCPSRSSRSRPLLRPSWRQLRGTASTFRPHSQSALIPPRRAGAGPVAPPPRGSKRQGFVVVTGGSRLLEGGRLLGNGRMTRDRPRALGVRQDLRDGRPLLVVVGVGDDLDQAAAVAGLLLLEGDLLARLPKAKRRYDLRHLPQGARRQRGVVQKLDAGMRPLCDSE